MSSFNLAYPPGKFIQLGAFKIHYELLGHGNEIVFLMPGGMGSTRAHFDPQLTDLNKEKLTILSWDPPGCGYSGPPDHCVYLDGFHRDAKVALQLLKALNFTGVNVVGWCGGAMTAMILTGLNPSLVKKLVLVSSWGHLDEAILRRWNTLKNIATWSPRMRNPLIQLHGITSVQSRWTQRLITFEQMMKKAVNGEIAKKEINSIVCPTLLIHCKDDNWVPIQRAQYLLDNIQNSKLVEFEDGNHYPHLSHPHRFNQLIEQFILNGDNF
ncbi:hypothetical protein CHUAL_000236 [Chamberlinius hualienensis]